MYAWKTSAGMNVVGVPLKQCLSVFLPSFRNASSAMPRKCSDQVRAINEKQTKPASRVIMDLDGIILDSIGPMLTSHDLYLLKWKKSLNQKQRYELVGRSSRDIGDIISKEFGLPVDGDVYAHGVWQFQRELFRKLKPKKGIEEFLCYFKEKKIPIALVTSTNEKTFRIKTKPHQGLIDMFCHIVTGDDREVLHGKPEPDLFEVAASRFSFGSPKDMQKYVVIDSSLSGIQAAKKAGMQTVLYPDRAIPPSFYKSADVTITSLESFDPGDFDFPLK